MRKILVKIKNIKGAIIALKKKGEQEMSEMICPNCQDKPSAETIRLSCTGMVIVKGIIQCEVCKHEFPFSMYGGKHESYIQKLDTSLPGAQSQELIAFVSTDIKEDIEEAERANYNQCYKACVTMCRRALQLGLIDKEITDWRLSEALKTALNRKLIEQKTYDLATSIKGYGDIGAHRREELNPEEVRMVIYATVRMLNEIFRKDDASM